MLQNVDIWYKGFFWKLELKFGNCFNFTNLIIFIENTTRFHSLYFSASRMFKPSNYSLQNHLMVYSTLNWKEYEYYATVLDFTRDTWNWNNLRLKFFCVSWYHRDNYLNQNVFSFTNPQARNLNQKITFRNISGWKAFRVECFQLSVFKLSNSKTCNLKASKLY